MTALTSHGHCAWCKRFTSGVRLVRLTDQGSGPGTRGLSACQPCRDTHGLTPLADRPL